MAEQDGTNAEEREEPEPRADAGEREPAGTQFGELDFPVVAVGASAGGLESSRGAATTPALRPGGGAGLCSTPLAGARQRLDRHSPLARPKCRSTKRPTECASSAIMST